MPAKTKLPTWEEQYEAYTRAKFAWEAKYAEWKAGGEVGSPPPMPVRPHTPGTR